MATLSANYISVRVTASRDITALQGKVVAHNDPDYLSTQNSYLSAQARSLFPACIATPTANTEVATIVKILVKGGVKFAIRGGGHSLNAGAANIESGVTINLRALNKVEVNKEQTVVSIQGGAEWGEVLFYFATETGKYAAPGLRNQFATTTFGGSFDFLQIVHSIWKSRIPSISSIVGVNWAMTIQPLPIAAMNQPEKVNSLGLSTSSGPLTLFLLSYNWENIEDDEEIKMAAKELISDIDEAAWAKGVGNDFKYLNYAAGW
ncbi:hypothetical protein BGAL_0102g00190 [Botrytis galanthina]|uniref:FAD-binding PCMH-type domain-containing protein n=1 Tax=Botrytis galanthina TaxID=278940 RepID=A0A4S8RBE9_9HELO|nr:hypothetical protein BGAL_0102g00190 [Botrytis galanthina]